MMKTLNLKKSCTAPAKYLRAVHRWIGWLWLLGLCAGPVHAQGGRPVQDIDAYFDAPYSRDYELRMEERIEAQIDRYFDRYNERVARARDGYWQRDLSSWEAYAASVAPNRARFRTITGVVDERLPVEMEHFGTAAHPARVAEADGYTVHQVRWPVLEGIFGEGLLLVPRGTVRARMVVLPDADQTPEQLAGLVPGIAPAHQTARRLAASGVQVVVPALVSRETTFSGSAEIVPQHYWIEGNETLDTLWSDQPHREWVYRQAYVMGRHLIGYEVQKILAAVDWFEQQEPGAVEIGVAGYGEGGLLALYAAAVDPRIDAALVSGYFGPREDLWQEPVYRNVWGLLKEFGDAEIASLIAPRALVVEYSEVPLARERPDVPADPNVPVGTPGRLATPPLSAVQQEVARLRGFFDGRLQPDVTLVHAAGGAPTGPGSAEALQALAEALGFSLAAAGPEPRLAGKAPDREARQKRLVEQISGHLLQEMHHLSDFRRYQFIDGDLSSPEAWEASMAPYRDHLYDEVIGRLPDGPVPLNPRLRKVFDEPTWDGYEVVLDVLPGVVGWGLLAVPKDLQEGERRPVVVVQHGHAGSPTTPVRVASYNRILPRLTQHGFIVFAPFGPYQFNIRKATPLKATVYSVIIPQHQQIVRWLKTLDYVDDDRIGFYGKSWGGRTALRAVPFVPDYRLAICSAYFNQWPRKVMTPYFRLSYQYTGSIGVYEFNQGNTFGHAEFAMLIAPRPFMVENGYRDPVMPAEWAAYEFAKVKRLYDWLGIGDRVVFGTHIGGHETHADTILPFLHKYLDHPVPATDWPTGWSME